MIEWTKNSIRTATERPYNYPGKGESIGSPFFRVQTGVFGGWGYRWGYKVGLHFLETGVTLLGYSGGAIKGG